ncbi:MAG: DUF4315 family protein [Acetatifactor muris]|nr:DUF4315 family protein [Acetatifactor muris]
MSAKLSRILDEIARTEEKIAVWKEHLEELKVRKKQLEDAEIIKSVRSMKLGSREMLAFLENLQSGMIPFGQEMPGMDTGQPENMQEQAEGYREQEKEPGEIKNNNVPEIGSAEREDRKDEEKD